MAASSALDDVEEALDALGAELDRGPVLGDDLVQLDRIVAKLDAIRLRQLRRFELEGGPEAGGALSTVAWLRHCCRMSPAAAALAVRAARTLESLPECQSAFAAGEVSMSHVHVITRCAQAVGLERFQEADRILTDLARQTHPKNVSYAARHLRGILDPDGAFEDYELNHERRAVHIGQLLDGMFHLEGYLDQEGGATLVTALEPLMRPTSPDDRRTAPQRRADALEELARQRLLAGDLPTSGGQKPHLVIFSTDRDFSGMVELLHAGPIPRQAAERLSCDAVAAVDGRPARRTFSPALRRAAEFLFRHCGHPGCDAPVSWCDGHHVKPYAEGGTTTVANSGLYCRRHHRIHHLAEQSKSPP